MTSLLYKFSAAKHSKFKVINKLISTIFLAPFQIAQDKYLSIVGVSSIGNENWDVYFDFLKIHFHI